jgi:hypothetical protein
VAKVAHSSQVRTDASAFFYSCFRFPQAIRKEIIVTKKLLLALDTPGTPAPHWWPEMRHCACKTT